MTLAFGPMKPVGLEDPRTGATPYAVVQLRQEDAAATAYNLVGFQTRMKYPDQQRVLRMIPGLEEAEFMRLGSVHRNTFVDAPRLLDESMQLRALPGVYLAGQITGVEGYVESAALRLRLRGDPRDGCSAKASGGLRRRRRWAACSRTSRSKISRAGWRARTCLAPRRRPRSAQLRRLPLRERTSQKEQQNAAFFDR
jgi:hypothetical protein